MTRLDDVRKQADKELDEEYFNQEVQDLKVQLRKAKWWHRLFPFIIKVQRRT